jgi:hypothetical protein
MQQWTGEERALAVKPHYQNGEMDGLGALSALISMLRVIDRFQKLCDKDTGRQFRREWIKV